LFDDDGKEEIKAVLRREFLPQTLAQRIKNKIKNSPIRDVYFALRADVNKSVLPHLSDKPYGVNKLNSAEQNLFNSFHLSMLPTLLRNFDRASMLNGVEVRMPFMDYRLVQYVFSLPTSSKIGEGYTKRILRDAMKGLMPEAIRLRKQKVGLNAPMYDWYNNKLSQIILDEVNSSAFLNSPYWNGKEIAAFATQKTRAKTWHGNDECMAFWRYFNTHLLQKN